MGEYTDASANPPLVQRYEFTAWVEDSEQTKASRRIIVSGMNYGNTANVLRRFIEEGLEMSPGSKMKIEVVRLVDKE